MGEKSSPSRPLAGCPERARKMRRRLLCDPRKKGQSLLGGENRRRIAKNRRQLFFSPLGMDESVANLMDPGRLPPTFALGNHVVLVGGRPIIDHRPAAYGAWPEAFGRCAGFCIEVAHA